ncbi:MAG: PAS domain-containing protein [Deltaproteobacteria bacterium]|nr:PAS domain-containing protein [Deltaproteobacteria bacterium]
MNPRKPTYEDLENEVKRLKKLATLGARTQREILTSHHKLHHLLSATSTIVYYTAETSGDYGATFISDNVVHMVGYEPPEFVEHSQFWIDHIHPDDRPSVTIEVPKLFKKEHVTYEYRFRCRDGRYIWIRDEMRLIRDPDGKPQEIIGYWIDITESKSVELALRESRRALSTLISNLPGMVYRCANDSAWTMEFLSAGCLALTGYSPRDIINNNKLSYADLIHPGDRELVWKTVQAALEVREPFRMEYRIFTAGHKERWVWEQGRGIFAAAGEVVALEGFITDITEQKGSLEALKKSSEEVKIFAYSVLHDLKAPTIGIYGLAKLLEKHYRKLLDPRGRDYCGRILEASEQIAALIGQINVYMATRESPLKIELVDLGDLIQMVKDEVSSQLNIRQIRWSEPKDHHVISVDRIGLLRILRNLVDNALKHGGEKLSEIKIGYSEFGEFHTLSVENDGVCIEKSSAERIFDLFKRGETSDKVEGAGLGLAIVKEIAEKHRGGVWVDPGVKTGPRFWVSLSKHLGQ